LLEILLAQHLRVASAGELFYLPRRLQDPEAKCTCGESVGSCSVWRRLSAELMDLARSKGLGERELVAALRDLESQEALAAYRKGDEPDPERLALYAAVQRILMQSLWRIKPEADFLVDSSKTQRGAAARPLLLSRHLGLPVHVIHLIRDCRGVVASELRGTNRDFERGTPSSKGRRGRTALITWLRAHRAVNHLTGRIGRDKVLRVRFEDLVAAPETVFDRIGAFLDLDISPILAAIENDAVRPVPHMITGNRMRLGPVRLDPAQAAFELPWLYQAPCALASWAAGSPSP
jgi:hypothetical protein